MKLGRIPLQLLSLLLFFFESAQSAESTTKMSTTTNRGRSDRMCYGCADSTNKEGRNDCQVNIAEMMIEAGRQLGKLAITDSKSRKKHLEYIDYVKNCSRLGPEYKYCVIEVIETRGDVYSYIRECSNGKNESFSPEMQKVGRIMNNLQADNQTTCANDRGSLYCVTMCESDFCNGPVPAGLPPLLVQSHLTLYALAVLSVIYCVIYGK